MEWFQQALQHEGVSRRALARGLCERSDWRTGMGPWCLFSASKVLPQLAGRLGMVLLPPKPGRPVRMGARPASCPDVVVDADLAAQGEITLERVTAPGQRRVWRGLMARHHPQGEPRQPGKPLSGLIRSARYGLVGGIGFCAAS